MNAALFIPLFIFFARICDVSIGTLRIMFISKGYKYLAPLIGFVEIMIWITVITTVLKHIDNWINMVAYAAGFAAGNYVGMLIEERLSLGHELIRIITKMNPDQLIEELNNEGFGITSIKADGFNGNVGVIYVIIQRKHIKQIQEIIMRYNPFALYTIEDIRFVNKQIYFKAPCYKEHKYLFFRKR